MNDSNGRHRVPQITADARFAQHCQRARLLCQVVCGFESMLQRTQESGSAERAVELDSLELNAMVEVSQGFKEIDGWLKRMQEVLKAAQVPSWIALTLPLIERLIN